MEWGKEGVLHNTPENVHMGWGKEGVLHNTPENVQKYTWDGGRRGDYTTLQRMYKSTPGMGEGGGTTQHSRECTKVHMGWGKEGVLHNTPENVHMGWGGEGGSKIYE